MLARTGQVLRRRRSDPSASRRAALQRPRGGAEAPPMPQASVRADRAAAASGGATLRRPCRSAAHLAGAVGERLGLADGVEADDRGARDLEELLRVEPAQQGRERRLHPQLFGGGVEPRQAFLKRERDHLLARHDAEARALAREEARPAPAQRRASGDRADARDRCRARPRAASERGMQPGAVDRLEQVVDGVQLEGVDRVLVVRRAEDDRRPRRPSDAATSSPLQPGIWMSRRTTSGVSSCDALDRPARRLRLRRRSRRRSRRPAAAAADRVPAASSSTSSARESSRPSVLHGSAPVTSSCRRLAAAVIARPASTTRPAQCAAPSGAAARRAPATVRSPNSSPSASSASVTPSLYTTSSIARRQREPVARKRRLGRTPSAGAARRGWTHHARRRRATTIDGGWPALTSVISPGGRIDLHVAPASRSARFPSSRRASRLSVANDVRCACQLAVARRVSSRACTLDATRPGGHALAGDVAEREGADRSAAICRAIEIAADRRAPAACAPPPSKPAICRQRLRQQVRLRRGGGRQLALEIAAPREPLAHPRQRAREPLRA